MPLARLTKNPKKPPPPIFQIALRQIVPCPEDQNLHPPPLIPPQKQLTKNQVIAEHINQIKNRFGKRKIID